MRRVLEISTPAFSACLLILLLLFIDTPTTATYTFHLCLTALSQSPSRTEEDPIVIVRFD